MTEPGKTVGRATCVLCGLQNQPMKVSKKGHLYFTCAPAADGGCEHQLFARGASSDRLLAAQITKWASKGDKEQWLGSSQAAMPEDEPEELEDEIQEAIEDGAIEVSPEPAPLPPPAASARRKARQASQSAPLVAKKKRPLPDFAKLKKEKSWSPF